MYVLKIIEIAENVERKRGLLVKLKIFILVNSGQGVAAIKVFPYTHHTHKYI